MYKLLIADPHRTNSDWVQQLTRQGFDSTIYGSGEEIIEAVRNNQYDAVLINKILPDMDGTKLASFIKKCNRDLLIFIVSGETNMELWREVSKAKAQLLPLPIDISRLLLLLEQQPTKVEEKVTVEVAATIEKEVDISAMNEDFSRNDLGQDNHMVEEKTEMPIDRESDEEIYKKTTPIKMNKKKKREIHQGEVIVLYSWKGGVGKTTTAVNLAAILQTYGDMSVGLVELTRQAGNILSHFSLNPTVTVKTWLDEKPDEKNALSRMLEDPATGMYILPSQTLLDYSKNPVTIPIREALRTIHVLRQILDVVIIDAGTLLDDFQFSMFQEADHILLISDLIFDTLKENHYMPEIFRRRNLDMDKVIHVINRVDKGLGITVKDANDIVLVPSVKTLPYRKEIMKKKESREPFVLGNDRNPYTTELKLLSADLFPDNEKLQCPQGWMKKVMKRFVG